MLRAEIGLHPRPFALAVTGAAIFALCTVASSIAIEWITDEVFIPRFEDGEVATSTVLTGAALIIGIGLVRAAGVVLRRIAAGITQWRIARTLGERVVERLIRQPVSWHHRLPDGDLVARAGVDTDAAVTVLAPIPFATGTVLLIVVSAIWLVVSDPVMGGAAIVVFPILIGINVVYQRRVDRYYNEAQEHLGALSAAVHESFDGVQLVKAFGAEQRETERVATIAGRLREVRVHAVTLRGTFEALLDVFPSMTNVGLVVLGSYRVRSGDVSVGELSSFIYLFTLLVFPLRLIGYVLSEIPHSLAGWKRVKSVIDEPVHADPRDAIGPTDAGYGVQLTDVVFTFPNESRPALAGVDLAIEAGRVVAVVGPTGSGKSTLVELVAGLVAPDRGTVQTAPGRSAMVFQESFLFSGTIRHNIVLGGGHDDPAVWAALRLAEAEEFVGETPHGLDTVVGERGVTLSGGQRQRVALARALVRQPRLLLLDDTTSALDPGTEAAVLTNLRAALSDTTVVMVASRPSTIALADEVVFLAGGRVADHGTHRELMQRRAGYRSLVEAFETDRAGSEPGEPEPDRRGPGDRQGTARSVPSPAGGGAGD